MPKFKKLAAFGFLTLAFAVVPTIQAGLVTIGPNGGPANNVLNDWGITFDSSGAVNWGPALDPHPNDLTVHQGTATHNGFSYTYSLEDYVGSGGLVGPRYGGQDYDAEFLGVGVDMNRLVVAIVSGQRPENGIANYAPGDLYISTNQGVFGVELTGETFHLNNNGHTESVNAIGNAGMVWKNPEWIEAEPDLSGTIDGVNYDANPALTKVQLKDGLGEMLGTLSEFYFSANDISGTGENAHSVFELAIPLGWFDGAEILGVHWSPSCGNDLIYPQTQISTLEPEAQISTLEPEAQISPVPEPTSLALFAVGMAGFGAAARRRRKK